MTIESAIEILRYNMGIADGEGAYKAFNMAISALRAQQEAEKNEPLTLEELREMDGQPVWLVSNDDNDDNFASWGIVRVFIEAEGSPVAVLCAERIYSGEKHYGKLWIAYRHPPKEAHND